MEQKKSIGENIFEFIFDLIWCLPMAFPVYFIASLITKDEKLSILLGAVTLIIAIRVEAMNTKITEANKEIKSMKEQLEKQKP